MEISLKKVQSCPGNQNVAVLFSDIKTLAEMKFDRKLISYVEKRTNSEEKIVIYNNYNHTLYFVQCDTETEPHKFFETLRVCGGKTAADLIEKKESSICAADMLHIRGAMTAFAEGFALRNYSFTKYKTNKEKIKRPVTNISFKSRTDSAEDLEKMLNVVEAVHFARDMINEPASYLTAETFATQIEQLSKLSGFSFKKYTKKEIEKLGMGGLLAVNQGSTEPPVFCILEWKPRSAKNKRPYVVIGKGIVYDSGGMSLKTTKNSMDYMKSDMSGGAAVAALLYALAKNKINRHVIGLIPATDNRIDANSYSPGDIITMHDKTTVEIMNTDAEGRLILADAISYANSYKPELIIDIATLTGAAASITGPLGVAAMGNIPQKIMNRLKESGNNVHERIAELPFWEEYAENLKSETADIMNLGGSFGGAMTAGKFLEKFAKYPFLHIDIAGAAFLSKSEAYRPKGGSGSGVRLLYDFISRP